MPTSPQLFRTTLKEGNLYDKSGAMSLDFEAGKDAFFPDFLYFVVR